MIATNTHDDMLEQQRPSFTLSVHHRFFRSNVRFGSKGEILAASKCFPLFSQQRTFNGATVRACRKRIASPCRFRRFKSMDTRLAPRRITNMQGQTVVCEGDVVTTAFMRYDVDLRPAKLSPAPTPANINA